MTKFIPAPYGLKLKSPSPFFEEDDNLYTDLFVDRLGTFDEINIDLIKTEVEEAAKEIASRKFDMVYQQELDKSILKGMVNAIISVTGDDEIICTNCTILVLLHFVGAKLLSGIKLSEKDTGISARKGNYAEGWIIMPPNKEASIDTVQRLHSGSGIAIVLDMLKLKLLSAVRKQSILETDFESKYADLYKSVEWIDRDWFTYDYGQSALVFATAIFDFRESKTSPYLYKSEGGTGGCPPWNNVETAMAGSEYMSHGKSAQSILHLMDEATCIQEGYMKPDNASFIQASHYVQAGQFQLEKIKAVKDKLSEFSKEEKLEILEEARGANLIPKTLISKSVVVEPKDKLLGCAISELRKNGLVMTELDVQSFIARRRKFSALLGTQNMGQVIREADEELTEAKRDAYRILSSMGTSANVIPITDYRSVMIDYYTVRKDRSDITAFSYAGQLRIFKSSDVLEEFEISSGGLKDEIISGMLVSRNYRLSHKIGKDREKVEYQIDWMESGKITHLFQGELPPGIGTDDARILRKLTLCLPLSEPTVFVILTDDGDMIKKITQFASHHVMMHIIRVGKIEYMRVCAKNEHTKPGEGSIYNFLTNKECRFASLHSRIQSFSLSWRNIPRYQILWDFPNINRGLEPLEKKVHRDGRVEFRTPAGGYLKRRTVQKLKSWAAMDWQSFNKLKDFTKKTKMIRNRRF